MDAQTSGKVLALFTKKIGTNFKQSELVCEEIAKELELDPEEVKDLVYTIWDLGYGLDAEKIEEEEEI
jgi:energy-converting hydrogenase A subunit M